MPTGPKPLAPLLAPGTSSSRIIWRQVPDNCLVLNGRVLPIHDEVTTREAAEILGWRRRKMQRFCTDGHLHEGIHWRKLPGRAANMRIMIRRDALERLRGREV